MFTSNDFYGTQLKFKARTGCLGIKENLARWGMTDSKCDLCKNASEDLPHFLFLCPALNELRNACYGKLEADLRNLGHEELWNRYMGSSILTKLCLFLGDHGYLFNKNVGALFDKTCKEFLRKAWSVRLAFYADQPRPTSELF